MPAEIYGERYQFLARSEVLTFEEIQRLARIFAKFGARKLRVTGGEPLVRAQLPKLIELLTAVEGIDDIALTTNGYLLAAQAKPLHDAGLDRVTVSLDSLDDNVFRQMNGRNFGTEPVLQGIDAAERAGFKQIKINCVVQRGVNDQTIVDLARHFKGTGHIVRFIEYMDVGTLNGWNLEQVVTAREILKTISSTMPLEPVKANYPGEVAKRYVYADGGGEIGIIASVSQPFCGDCTRARLSTDGRFVTCLFSSGGKDLRGPIRAGASDDDMMRLISTVWSNREDRYSEIRTSEMNVRGGKEEHSKIEMFRMGG